MFQNLSERLTQSLRSISGKARLTEDNIQGTLREVRMALLEADVALPVVKQFVDAVKTRALGQEVMSSLSPGQAFLKIVQAELESVMGEANEGLNLSAQPPAVVLLAGLQGAGKTTSAAKLARLLKERERKKVTLVSADVYRPAAIKQLETLAGEVGVDFFPSSPDQKPVDIALAAREHAKIRFSDVLIVDTAGRLAIDEAMMAEIAELERAVTPVETLFVVDAMTGQDAANTAKAFGDALPLTGVILTKVDADTRGGAALSVRQITGKPIKFLGVGEKSEALDPFHPDRLASRILGMGDMLSLIEEAEQKVDRAKAEKLARKVKKGKKFDLEDLRDQLQQMNNMGGMASMLDKMPGMGNMAQMAQAQMDNRSFARMEAMINSMTPRERRNPELIQGSRKRRITMGS
ncbi:MAG: signal recognition particle protein, partial [Halieaceae bacterium]|nr:signal recognition particle protein [Halieaceae bacterium]